MDNQEIRETSIWDLYEKGRNYHRSVDIYVDTDRNYRMYNGNQWEYAKLGDVEPVQKNFIKPVVKYKVSVIHDNLYAINYSSQNYENREFRKQAERYCKMLNGYAAKAWEQDKMDFKGRRVTKDAAINDEGIIYVDFDKVKMLPVNEIVKKSDIYYGNENDDDIQAQPYILIRKRMTVSKARDLALSFGVSKSKSEYIIGDSDSFEESGEAAKVEIDNAVTVIYKFYKQDGKVNYSIATRLCDIATDIETGLSLYPVAHFNWEEKEGSARGEGEVRRLIPNQIEVNRTEMRRVLTVKSQAYPHKVVNVSRVENPEAIDAVGGTIYTNSSTVDDVHKIVGTLPPAQMSSDVKLLQDDLINLSRELAGAGDAVTGQVDPEKTSGRAVLAVLQASQAPMTEQKESFKNLIEDVAKIWLEYLIVHSVNGIKMEEEIADPETGKKVTVLTTVPQSVLRALQATVKIDVTPRSPFDKFAQEQTLEAFLTGGYFTAQRVGELKAYAEALPDDAVSPKLQLLEIADKIEQKMQKIAQLESQARLMQQSANDFLMADPDGQADQIIEAQNALKAAQSATPTVDKTLKDIELTEGDY